MQAQAMALVAGVVLSDRAQHLGLDERLLVEARLVPDHLDGHRPLHLVVEGAEYLPEGAATHDAEHLIPVVQVVVQRHMVVATLVVVPVIMLARQQRRARLARGLASPIDGPHVADLGTLILRKPGGAQSTQHFVA